MTTNRATKWTAVGIVLFLLIVLLVDRLGDHKSEGPFPNDLGFPGLAAGPMVVTLVGEQQRPICSSSGSAAEENACREAGTRDRVRRHYRQNDWGQHRNPFQGMARTAPVAYANLAQEYRQGVRRYKHHHRTTEASARLLRPTLRGFSRSSDCAMPLGAGMNSPSFWCWWSKKQTELEKPIRDESMDVVIQCGGAYATAMTGDGIIRHQTKILSAISRSTLTEATIGGCIAQHLVIDILNAVFNGGRRS